MPTTASSREYAAPTAHAVHHHNGPIVVASDGTAHAEAAFSMAKLLRAQTGAILRVVSVVEPLAAIAPAPLLLSNPLDGSRVSQRHAVVHDQITRFLDSSDDVPLEIHVGWPPEVLAQVVRDSDASFFVAAMVRHGRLERLARMETPLAVLRGAGTPVLALPERVTHPPRAVVVGVDLTTTCVGAAEAAAPLLHEAGTVHLLHVRQPVPPLAEPALLPADDTDAIERAFERITEALRLPAGAQVERRVLSGNPAFEIADFAEFARADLIVLGHEHRGMWGRMLHSSVAEHVYRSASCAVLIVPDPCYDSRHPARMGIGVRTEVFARREDWAHQLAAFTERNVGRRVNLEVLTPVLGAQAAVINFPLLGIDFDPAVASVDIMLGDDRRGARHLAHAVHDVTAIELSRHESGADWALRLGHGGGQTLLTFVR